MTTISFGPWVSCYTPNPRARLRLFCFPHAGGGASLFRGWANDLPSQVQVLPIQLPGREERLREPPFTQLYPLVETLIQVLRPGLDGPFAFFGHSLGALLVFELAHQLYRRYGLVPVHLFISGYRAPQIPDDELPLCQLPDASFVAEMCRRYNAIPREIVADPELLELFLPLLRADLALTETYRWTRREPLPCPISAFGGREDKHPTPIELEGWRDHTQSIFRLRLLPGDHFFVRSARPMLLQAVSNDLSAVYDSSRSTG